MYTSGQFAGMFRVSKKLLRYYNDIDLLKPSEIDSMNGYSYYDKNSCERMKRILYLRSLLIPLNEIKYLLELPEDGWSNMVHRHLMKIRTEHRSLERIETELISLEKSY